MFIFSCAFVVMLKKFDTSSSSPLLLHYIGLAHFCSGLWDQAKIKSCKTMFSNDNTMTTSLLDEFSCRRGFRAHRSVRMRADLSRWIQWLVKSFAPPFPVSTSFSSASVERVGKLSTLVPSDQSQCSKACMKSDKVVTPPLSQCFID